MSKNIWILLVFGFGLVVIPLVNLATVYFDWVPRSIPRGGWYALTTLYIIGSILIATAIAHALTHRGEGQAKDEQGKNDHPHDGHPK